MVSGSAPFPVMTMTTTTTSGLPLLKIGATVLNLERATCIRDLSTRDAAGNVTRGLFRVEFGDAPCVEIARDAEAFRAWLEANTTVLG